jgi:hypothetical protein
LGNTPAESFLSFEKQVFTIVNSQTAYTLSFSVANENDIRLVINNVIQEPGTGKAYTASGTTLTLSSALTNGTDEMYCVFLGRARETVTVPTITKDKLNLISNATAGLTVKGDGGSNDGYIQLNCRQNSHGIKLKSPPHSASQSYTLTFPSTAPATDKFLKTDSSGNLSFADASSDFVRIFTSTVSSAHDYINFDNVFSSSYDNYLVVGRINNTFGGTNLGVRFRASGSTETGNNYNRYGTRLTSSSYNNSTSQSYMAMYNADDVNDDIAFYFYVHTPFDSSHSGHIMGSMTSRAGIGMYFAGNVRNTTSYDGISIFNVNTSAGDLNNSKTTIYGLTNA